MPTTYRSLGWDSYNILILYLYTSFCVSLSFRSFFLVGAKICPISIFYPEAGYLNSIEEINSSWVT